MKLFNSYNRRTHPAFPSNEAEAAIEAARQQVATASEAEKWFASQPTDSRKKEISEWIKEPAEIPRHGVIRSQE